MLRSDFKRNNNKGFTLLEVLVAMIILAIMSVPFARAFATAAQTNQKARIEAKCSNVAENLAEEFRNVSVEELIDKYGASSENTITKDEGVNALATTSGTIEYNVADGTGVFKNQNRYLFEIKDQNDIGNGMPEGYYATVELESVFYNNTNGLNLSQVAPVSIKDSAIYTMEEDLDKRAYEYYRQENDIARADNNKYADILTNRVSVPDPTKETELDKKLRETQEYTFLRENLYRTITINIKKIGNKTVTSSGEEDEKIDVVEVTMKIDYELKGFGDKFFPSNKSKYTLVDSYLFDNSNSTNEYRGMYLFFYPRYDAGSVNKYEERDKIVVENYDNVKSTLYLVALAETQYEAKKDSYFAEPYGLHVKIYEKDSTDGEGAITLRTNLNTHVPYSVADTEIGKVKFDLEYWNNVNTHNCIKKGAEAAEYFNAQNVDGKALDSEKAPKRIYKMNVKILPVDATPSGDNAVVEFDGTKLEF